MLKIQEENIPVTSLPEIQKELDWLSKVIEYRIEKHFSGNEDWNIERDVPTPDLSQSTSEYSRLILENNFSVEERLIILMALAVHMSPVVFDIFFMKNQDFNRGYTEFGGVTGTSHSGFIPTGETVSFLLCGRNLEKRFQLLDCFTNNHAFHNQNILHLTDVKDGEPVFSGSLSISKEYLSLFATGKAYEPQYTSTFPAIKLTTELSWDEAVYDEHTKTELEDIRGWMNYGRDIMKNPLLRKYLKQGFRVLFHGPPGTGKTMTAAILGKESGMDVYQVDLSSVVSKYIGETEKNLSSLFNLAENKGWILFFDEADSLFGKRTNTQSSNDQFANQQVGYLLQRIENYNGVVILATNFKDNIDAAFLRRFQSVIYFPKPKLEQRIELWQKYFTSIFEVDADFEKIAAEYELSGGSIINVLRHCSIVAMKRRNNKINHHDILQGINKEYQKEGISR